MKYEELITKINIFLDECVPKEVKPELIKRGYLNIFTVVDLGYIGARDCKLLRLIKEKHLLLITYDKKFHKTAYKYNDSGSILLYNNCGFKYGNRTITSHICSEINKNNKQICKFFNL